MYGSSIKVEIDTVVYKRKRSTDGAAGVKIEPIEIELTLTNESTVAEVLDAIAYINFATLTQAIREAGIKLTPKDIKIVGCGSSALTQVAVDDANGIIRIDSADL